jgi:hypothetical protein
LKLKAELRAITNSERKRESAVVISSTIPSASQSDFGSSGMLWNGRTTSEGRSEFGAGAAGSGCGETAQTGTSRQ